MLLQAALQRRRLGRGRATGRKRPSSRRPPPRLGLGLMGVRVDQLEQPDAALAQGMSGYLLPFEIISVHLLVVLIGAAYLARARTSQASRQIDAADCRIDHGADR